MTDSTPSPDNANLPKNLRIADDEVYREARKEPKEIWKFMAELMKRAGLKGPLDFLDVGCAAGETLRYMRETFPGSTCHGVDVARSLLAKASQILPEGKFEYGSILEPASFVKPDYDVVICNGTVQIFDDIDGPVKALLGCLRPNGYLMLHTLYNELPIDLLTRYRRQGGEAPGPWESGWNVFSKIAFEQILRSSGVKLDWSWHPFRLPIAVAPQEDPMRSYTMETADNPFQQRNGAGLLVNTAVLMARRLPG